MASPDDVMRDGRPHHRVFLAQFNGPGGLEILVTEVWDDDGTVDREVSYRTSYGPYSAPVELRKVG
jgi:hypothetical protein